MGFVLLWNLGIATAVVNLVGCYDRYQSQRTKLSTLDPSSTDANSTDAESDISMPLPQIGCPKAADWSIANAEIMQDGWRVFEVEFFEDIACTQTLMPIKIEGSSPMRCETTWELGSAFDKKKSTLWVSSCGVQSQCGFAHTTSGRGDTLRPIPAPCRPLEAYLLVSFDEPVALNCVRILQATAPFKAQKIVISAHLGEECYRCAEGAMDVTTPFYIATNSTNATESQLVGSMSLSADEGPAVHKVCSQVDSIDPFPCYDTLIGTPGLLGRYYNDMDLLRTFGDGEVDWDEYQSSLVMESMSWAVNYEISTSPMVPNVTHNTFAVRWAGYLRIPSDGKYSFSILSAGHARFIIGNDTVIDNPSQQTRGGTHSPDAVRYFDEGDMVDVSVEYLPLYNENIAGITLTWKGPKPYDKWRIITQDYLLQRMMQEIEQQKVVYVSYPDMHCYADRMGSNLPTYSSARAKCDLDDTCAAVYGKNCVNGFPTSSINLCKIGFSAEESDEYSCILVKEFANDEVVVTTPAPRRDSASSVVLPWLLLLL